LKKKLKNIYKYFTYKLEQNRLDYFLTGFLNIPKILINDNKLEKINIIAFIKEIITYIKNKIQFIFKINYLPHQDHAKLLVTGAGRSCTTWIAQICYSICKFDFQIEKEDRSFPWKIILKPNYGSKLATENLGFTKSMLKNKMEFYEGLKIIWCFKHPVANAMAKIVRGQPSIKGGDSKNNILASDATVETSIIAVKKSFKLFSYFKSQFPSRVLMVKLEDLILNSKATLKEICDFLNTPFDFNYLLSFRNTPNIYQRKRYGDEIDKSQAKIFQNWKNAYNGYFKNRKEDIKRLIDGLTEICKELNYSVELNNANKIKS